MTTPFAPLKEIQADEIECPECATIINRDDATMCQSCINRLSIDEIAARITGNEPYASASDVEAAGIEFVVIEDGEIVRRTYDANRVAVAQRGSRVVEVAVILPLCAVDPIVGYGLEITGDAPHSFHIHLPAALAAADRYLEATGQTVPVQRGIGFFVSAAFHRTPDSCN